MGIQQYQRPYETTARNKKYELNTNPKAFFLFKEKDLKITYERKLKKKC